MHRVSGRLLGGFGDLHVRRSEERHEALPLEGRRHRLEPRASGARRLLAVGLGGMLIAGLAAAPALSRRAFHAGHYVSESTCANEHSLHCHTIVVLAAGRRAITSFDTTVHCSQRGLYPTPAHVRLRNVRLSMRGRFDSGSRKQTDAAGDTIRMRIKGRIRGRHAKGTIIYFFRESPSEDDPDPTPCEERSAAFSATFRAQPLYRTGRYAGQTACDTQYSDCPDQSYRIGFGLRRGRISNLTTLVRCVQSDDNSVHERAFYLDRIAIDWAGQFSGTAVEKGDPNAYVTARGRIVGSRARGELEYEYDNVPNCSARTPTFIADRQAR